MHPNKLAFPVGLAFLALPLLASASDIYKFVDASGVPHFSNVPDSSRYQLVLHDSEDYKLQAGDRYQLRRGGARPGTTSASDDDHPYGTLIRREALSNSIDPLLVDALISVESNHNPEARSSRGAVGLMQLMPETIKRYGVAEPLHAESNIRGGTRYLRDLLAMFDGDVSLALAAYNAGENAVIRYGMRIPPFAETRAYVPKVLKKYDELRVRVASRGRTALPPPRASHGTS